MRRTNELIPALVVLSLSGSSCHAKVPEEVQQLRWLEKADPIHDARKALFQGDIRLRAVYGLTTYIPGTDSKDFQSLKRRFGINPIEGTSDCIVSKEHGHLVEQAEQYAKSYNHYIISNYKP